MYKIKILDKVLNYDVTVVAIITISIITKTNPDINMALIHYMLIQR